MACSYAIFALGFATTLSELDLEISGFRGEISDWNSSVSRTIVPPPPTDRIYNTSGGPVDGKVNIHINPHSHDDTGWLETVDAYFFKDVYYLLDTIVDQLLKDSNRKFSFAEIAFFARWWEEQPDSRRNATRQLVENSQLEFINGGWCMHDEASPHYVEMVDQTTRGHQFLIKHLGAKANPRAAWQIDPFGHSATQAWLLSSEAGMQSLFFGRMDYQDFNARKPEKRLEWLWQGSDSLPSLLTFTGELYGAGGGHYNTWIDFNGNGGQINDNPKRHDYNVDKWIDRFVEDALKQAKNTRTDHQLWACGDDFHYENAAHWYHNLDKLIHYLNKDGRVNAFYSTPSMYADAKNKANLSWEVRSHDDIFPYADGGHKYWSGYFTSRPSLKRHVRFASNFLNSARQMEVLSNISAEDVDHPTVRPSPTVGDSFTDSLEGTVGVTTHHDAMSGTSTQAVANDYHQRMSESSFEVEAGVNLALQRLIKTDVNFTHCNCNTGGDCLNMSVCTHTVRYDNFVVVAWNPLGQTTRSLIRLPVLGDDWSVTGINGTVVESQAVPLDERTRQLPLLYINRHNLNESQMRRAEMALENNATHILTFNVELPAVGYSIFSVNRSFTELKHQQTTFTPNRKVTVNNGVYELTFIKNQSRYIRNLVSNSNVMMPLNITWGFYKASTGGCTRTERRVPRGGCVKWCNTGGCSKDGPRQPQFDKRCNETIQPGSSGFCECDNNVRVGPSPGCGHEKFQCSDICQGKYPSWCFEGSDNQKSGAYIFRPNSSDVFFPGYAREPTLEVIVGSVVTEVRQVYSSWVSHVFRLVKGEPYVELEWTVGPIPSAQWGKEVIVRYDTTLNSSGVFYTDSNGREMMRREYNARPSTYPSLDVTEPVAGNYFPVNTIASLDDGKTELAVMTDVTQGGASLASGSLELMVHRRLLHDDQRGVGEPLDETMCGCRGDDCDCAGLTMRGRHWFMMDSLEAVHVARRELSERLNFGPTLAFAPSTTALAGRTFSALAADLPPNVKLQTLTSNYARVHAGRVLFRLSHLYSVKEHSTLSSPVVLNLFAIFREPWRITECEEMSLTANQNRCMLENNTYQWRSNISLPATKKRPSAKCLSVILQPMEVKTFLVKLNNHASLAVV